MESLDDIKLHDMVLFLIMHFANQYHLRVFNVINHLSERNTMPVTHPDNLLSLAHCTCKQTSQ
jgi:hypothetical protein